jgi:branched-chain amino acid transport system ATP-binding protein
MTSILQTRALTRRFGALVVADKIDFSLAKGDRHALIGPNGAGKTTFVNMVSGRLAPSSGTVWLGGEDVTGLRQAARVKRGLVRTFQINTLCLRMTVLENLLLALCEREGLAWSPVQPLGRCHPVIDEANDLLRQFELQARADLFVAELPYGEQRMVEILLGLALKPRVLLLDEPAAGVPAGESRRILDALALLPADMAILIIEHDMDIVFRFATHITVLHEGRVVAAGPSAAIAADAQVQAIYFGRSVEVPHG